MHKMLYFVQWGGVIFNILKDKAEILSLLLSS